MDACFYFIAPLVYNVSLLLNEELSQLLWWYIQYGDVRDSYDLNRLEGGAPCLGVALKVGGFALELFRGCEAFCY